MQKKVKAEVEYKLKVSIEEVTVRTGKVYVRLSVNNREKWINYADANNDSKDI